MKFKNTFYNWLTNRFILIIRNEENFAVKSTFSFNYAKVIVVGIFMFLLLFSLSFYLVTTALAKWYNPEYAQMQNTKKVITLSSKVDSLAIELDRKDKYINHFKSLITGDVLKKSEDIKEDQNHNYRNHVNVDKTSKEDSLLRKKFEDEALLKKFSKKSLNLDGLTFYPPVEGIVTTDYNLSKGVKGIKLATGKEEPLLAMTDGLVLHISTNAGKSILLVGNEKFNLMVKYFFTGEVNVKEGDKVKAGEVVGLVSEANNEGVGLETWYEGRVVNPKYFVSF